MSVTSSQTAESHEDAPAPTATFSGDQPIKSKSEDLLGRVSFSTALKDAFVGWRGNESLVVALEGSWGSGKSSVKNLIRESITSDSPQELEVVEFNPWEWAGHRELTEAFFGEVGHVVGRGDRSSSAASRAKAWKAYAAYLQAGSLISDALYRVAGIALIIAGSLGILIGFSGSPVLRTVAVVLGILAFIFGALFRWGGRFSETLATVFEKRSEAVRESLSDRKRVLRSLLREMKKPILIIIDDIDRLLPEEVHHVFQLVKANADFPNLIFFLLYQRDIVESSLEKVAPGEGRSFLEKIVQVSMSLPPIQRAHLEQVLFEGLDRSIDSPEINRFFDQKRWANLYMGALRSFFTSLRDIRRYLNTFSFHVSIFQKQGVFEVNPIDLIGLEVLRVFEPDVYSGLLSAKEQLTSPRPSVSLYGEKAERETRAVVESLVAGASEEHRDHVKALLVELFPGIGWVFDESKWTSADLFFRELRVAHPDVFERYFLLDTPHGDVSQSELARILASAKSRNGLRSELEAMRVRGMLDVVLDRLEPYKEEFDLEHAIPIVTAIFDIGDGLRSDLRGFFDVPPDMTAVRIVYWFLKKEPNRARRSAILEASIRETNGLYLPVKFVSLEDSDSRATKPDETLVDDHELELLKEACLEKLRHAASKDLILHPELLYLLYRYREWAGEEEVQIWVESALQSRNSFIKFLSIFVQPTHSMVQGEHSTTTTWKLRLNDLKRFVAVDRIEQYLLGIRKDDLGPEEARVCEAFFDAVERVRSGNVDDEGSVRAG